MLLKSKPNPTKSDAAQLARWNLFLNGWKKAAKSKMCILVGDMNLDYLQWDKPEPRHAKMVQRTKDTIEEAGHIQLIQGMTRCWRGQADSLVDHCWVSRPQRIVSHLNEVRASSDHNLISLLVRTKDKMCVSQELLKRSWKDFSPTKFQQELGMIDWSSFYQTDNLDYMNTFFEEHVGAALEKVIPIKLIQVRKNHCNWIDSELKDLMSLRDRRRETARLSSLQADWDSYRSTRNKCTKMLRRKKVEHSAALYDSFKDTKDTKNIFKVTKDILGWVNSGQPTCFIWEGKITRKPAELANIFQNYFSKKIEKLI